MPKKMLPSFLDRIKNQTVDRAVDKVKERIRKELAPDVPETSADVPEEPLATSFTERIKKKVKDTVSNLSPAQEMMLDPNAPLDMETLKYRIQYAGRNHLLLYLTYNDQPRHVEPYSYRMRGKPKQPGGPQTLLFFGYCRIHDSIHAFKLDGISSCVVTDQPFQPRWTVELV